MISVTHNELEKIKLLDRLLCSLDINELTELVDSEQIVAKLKGSGSNSMLLERLVNDSSTNTVDLLNAKNELASLKSDFQTLLRILNTTVFSYSPDMTSLKQKHNIY